MAPTDFGGKPKPLQTQTTLTARPARGGTGSGCGWGRDETVARLHSTLHARVQASRSLTITVWDRQVVP